MPELILASASPRREELLKKLGLKFTIVPSKINENKYNDLTPGKLVKELARAKAEDVAQLVEDTVIIAADTVVVCNDRILGKPEDKDDARQMLRLLQGTKHEVITGLAVLSTRTGKSVVDNDLTEVYMRKMDNDEIIDYVDTGEPLDKAGSYGIQGLGGIFVEKIIGSYFTVMGLPIHKLAIMLKQFSIKIL